MSRVLYRLVAAFARLTVRSGRSKDLEIIALRHQLTVLRRQIDQPKLDDHDRSLLGAIAAALAPPAQRSPLDPPHRRTRQTANLGLRVGAAAV